MTHVSNFGHGTMFYRAPEIIVLSQASTGSDVYSFGVLMIELFTSLAPVTLQKRFSTNKIVHDGHSITSSTTSVETKGQLRPSEFLRDVFLARGGRGLGMGGLGEWGTVPCYESYRDLAIKCLDDDSKSRPGFSTILEEIKRMKAAYPSELVANETAAEPADK